MKLSVTGLAKLPATGYYTVYLMRDGKVFAPCGTFVSAGKAHAATVQQSCGQCHGVYRERFDDGSFRVKK